MELGELLDVLLEVVVQAKVKVLPHLVVVLYWLLLRYRHIIKGYDFEAVNDHDHIERGRFPYGLARELVVLLAR